MIRRFIQIIVCLLSVSLLILVSSSSVLSQAFPNLGISEDTPSFSTSIPVFRIGNLEIAPVFLDGRLGGTVTSFVDYRNQNGEQPREPYGAAVRSQLMNNNLQKTLDTMVQYSNEVLTQRGITGIAAQERELREQLVVSVAKQRETTVVQLAFPKNDTPDIIFSVTQAEIARPRFGGSQPLSIAEKTAVHIENSLIQAWRERQPPYLLAQARRALLILILLTVTSLGVRRLQQYLTARKSRLKEKLNLEPQDDSRENSEELDEITQKIQFLLLNKQYSLNKLYIALLFWSQWLLWVLGIGYLMSLFYWTRPLSNWIMGVTIRRAWTGQFLTDGWPPTDWLLSFGREATLGVPLFVLFLVLMSRLTLKAGDLLSDFLARHWFENPGSNRYSLRVPTLATFLKGWLRVMVYLLVGVILAYQLQQLGAITQVVAVLLGFISFALSLASQNVLKDLIAGLFILWEDQYAVGDVITVNEIGGLVEKITLRITQLRNLDGELITIPNGEIGKVRNLSSDWARVNYAIEVSYHDDVNQVLAIMKEIAEQLCQDPEWSDKILDSPQVLGVDNISHQGILIRLLIKTKPLQQWPIGRELRLRLKKAFDEQGISVGVPEQTMYVQDIASLKNNDKP